jgi:TetR/AcrR family transcriptional regulator, copper-responsive repressor
VTQRASSEARKATATDVFWQYGHEATSVNDLTRALGITPPSLYSAFGSKRALFEEVVAHYQATSGAPVREALLSGTTAREGVAAMLEQAAADYTDPAHPPGRLVISAATNCGAESAEVQRELRRTRQAGIDAITQRLSSAAAAGELPRDTDPQALAGFSAAVLQGMSQRARDGAGRAEPRQTAATAMRAWPLRHDAGPCPSGGGAGRAG